MGRRNDLPGTEKLDQVDNPYVYVDELPGLPVVRVRRSDLAFQSEPW